MLRSNSPAKGVALIAVLTVLLVVAILGSIMAMLMSSQGTLTHHQVQRVRASYAAQAGINLAYSKLCQGLWAYNTNYAINCTSAACTGAVTNPANRFSDPGIPFEVIIRVGPVVVGGPRPGTASIDASVNYTNP